MSGRGRIAVAWIAALLTLPAAAQADNRIENRDGEATIVSEDAGVANEFQVGQQGSEIRFFEPKDPKGMNTFPPNCRPGQTRSGVIIEVFCPRSSITKSVGVFSGPDGDSVTYAVAGLPGVLSGDTGIDNIQSTADSPDVIDGEQGNDVLDGGPGDDEVDGSDGDDQLKGGDGNDKLDGGPGVDTLDGGPGDDTFATADGYKDVLACGDGNDTVTADQLDETTDCENVQRRQVEPAAQTEPSQDTQRPTLVAAALTTQRIGGRRRSVTLVATSSEKGLVQVTAFLEAGGTNQPLKPRRAQVQVGGGGVRVTLRLSRRQLRTVRRDLRRKRRPRVRITVSSVDAAGNTSRIRHLTIRLRRR